MEGFPLTIDDEIENYIIPLTPSEANQLERRILEEGCRDSLIVWQTPEKKFVIVDGHNRYRICQKHNIPFTCKSIPFRDVEQVKLWMIGNQIGRRNLSQEQLSYYRGLKYISLKKDKGGFEKVKSKGKVVDSTALLLSKEFNVSESTIKRDSRYAAGINLVGEIYPDLKTKILTGELSLKKGEVEALRGITNPKELLQALQRRCGKHNKYVNGRSLIISTEEGEFKRIKRIKGMINSTIERLIHDRNKEDIKELKLLITKFEDQLFSERKECGR